MLQFLFGYLCTICAWCGLVSFTLYMIPILLARFVYGEQNLKSKYSARWALVTGGSSGIGRCLVERCAKQGLNVVIVALDDEHLSSTFSDMCSSFPSLSFRRVGVDLTKSNPKTMEEDYLLKIREATQDLCVQVVFNNAGYIIIKSFARDTLDNQVKNIECNVLSQVKVAHVFIERMMKSKKKGCVCFTSSSAGYFPAPLSCGYSAGKAFLSQFVQSLYIECKPYGVDVFALNSGPMRTKFYDKLPGLNVFGFFNNIMDTPNDVAAVMFKCVGRMCMRDSHIYSIATRLIGRIVDPNQLCWIIAIAQPFTKDYKQFKNELF